MKTEALIILKKVQSLQRGQDLHDVGNSAQDRCLHELDVKVEQFIVISLLNFLVEIFQLEAKWKFVETLRPYMREKLMDQEEEKYRMSEWAEPTSVASRRQ